MTEYTHDNGMTSPHPDEGPTMVEDDCSCPSCMAKFEAEMRRRGIPVPSRHDVIMRECDELERRDR